MTNKLSPKKIQVSLMNRMVTKPIMPLNIQEISVIRAYPIYICSDLGLQFVCSLASNSLHMCV